MKPLDYLLKPILPVIAALLVLLFQSATLKAQEYPVNVTTIVTPPYSLYLSDYASPEGNAMQVIIQLRELDRPEYRVKLRVTIEGQGITLRTKPSYIPRALVLQGGVPEILTGPDLSAYLNPDNLDFSGISRQEFLKKATFPEGFYTFKIEVVDYARDVVVSNAGLANAWIILNDPPLINLPFNEEKVNATDPQNVMFSWTPRHAASPNAAFSTEYEFTLVELYPANRNPNDAIRAANSIFVTQTTSTSLNYGIMEPLLIPGRKYAFRIRAYDIDGRDLFKNNGYSEVHVFQFGDACIPPPGIKADALDAVRMKLSWDQIDLHTGYGIKFRKKGSSSWQEENVFSNSSIIPGLQAGTTYEYQVKGVCGSIQGDFSPVATVLLPESAESEFSCGAPVPAVELKTTPLPGGLKVDDVIKTSDFEISVSEVTANADGSYKGKGFALIPWFKFASVRVKFSNIQVNEEYRVYSGNVTTIYDPNSRFKVELDLSKDEMEGEKGDGTTPVTDFNDPNFDGVDTTYAGTIAAITVDAATGAVTIVDANGTSVTIPRKENTKTDDPDDHEPMRVTDSKGDTYIVDKDGNVLQAPSTAPPGAVASRDSVNFTVNFAANANQEYGFDKKDDTALGTYDKTSIQGKDYLIPWKAVEVGRQDAVTVSAEGKKNFPATVGFKTITGPVPSQAGASADLKQIFVTGKSPDDTEAVSAYVLLQEPGQTSPQEIEVGKINVKTYSKIKQKLFVVPVNDAPVPDRNLLSTEINKIYQQAVAEWDITVDAKFTINNESIAGLDAEESGRFASYNQKMQQFNRAFKDDRSIDKDAYYIFLIKGSGSNRSGIMPFKKQFGYVFTDNTSDLLTTIAHELGHGAFNLRHTFSEFPAVSERSTQNLMDYKGGRELKKYQWDNVHDPEAMIGWLQDDDESAALALITIAEGPSEPGKFQMSPTNPCSRKVLLPFGKVVEFDAALFASITELNIAGNKLKSFKKNGVEYSPVFTVEKNGDTYVGQHTSYYFVDWASVKNNANKPGTGITTEEILDKDQKPHTVYNGVLSTSYVIQFSPLAVCEKNMVIRDDGTCYETQASDCGSGSGGNGQSAGNIINHATTVFSPEELKKALDGLTTANNNGLNAIIYITDDKTDPNVVNQVKEALNKGSESQAIIWVNIKADKTIEIKDIRIGPKSIFDKNGNNISSAIQRFLSFFAGMPSLNFNPLTAILDGLGGLIKNLTISEKYWNPESVDDKGVPNYSDAFLTVYHYSRALSSLGTSLLFADMKVSKYTIEQIEFATVCGFYDGLINTIAGLPEGASFIIKFILNEDDTRTNIFNAFDQMQASCGKSHIEVYIAIPGVQAYGYGKCAWDVIKKYFSTGNECQIAYKSGGAIFQIVTIFIAFAKVGALAKVATMMDLLDPLALALRGALKLVKPIIAGGRALYKAGKHYITFVVENGKYVIKLANEAGDILGNIDWRSVVRWAEVTDGLGNRYRVGLMLDGSEFDLAIQKIKDAKATLNMTKYPDGKQVEIDGLQIGEVSSPGEDPIVAIVTPAAPDVPPGLINKLTQSGADKLKSWLSGRTMNYKSLSGVDAQLKVYQDLDGFLANKKVLDVHDDGKRLLVQCERGDKTHRVYSIERTSPSHPEKRGEYVIHEYAPTYKASANTTIDVDMSVNRLAPDYTTKGGAYLYPSSSLSPGQVNTIEITLTGDMAKDFKEANRLAGFQSFGSDAPDLNDVQYTWHHLDDFDPETGKCTLQLVEQSAHTKVEGMGHSGGAAQYRTFHGTGY